jgi:hypothetical protein
MSTEFERLHFSEFVSDFGLRISDFRVFTARVLTEGAP